MTFEIYWKKTKKIPLQYLSLHFLMYFVLLARARYVLPHLLMFTVSLMELWLQKWSKIL